MKRAAGVDEYECHAAVFAALDVVDEKGEPADGAGVVSCVFTAATAAAAVCWAF